MVHEPCGVEAVIYSFPTSLHRSIFIKYSVYGPLYLVLEERPGGFKPAPPAPWLCTKMNRKVTNREAFAFGSGLFSHSLVTVVGSA